MCPISRAPGRLFRHAGCHLSAVRDPQCAHASPRSSSSPRAGRRTNSSACTAWAGCCTPRPRARSRIFRPVRVYAPVGEHKDLLAYLVRRLLENGANTSFVNRFMDEEVPVADIVRDPITELERLESHAHSATAQSGRAVCRPAQFARNRSRRSARRSAALRAAIAARAARARGGAVIDGAPAGRGEHAVANPADRRETVGHSRDATAQEIGRAFEAGGRGAAGMDALGGAVRAECLDRAAAAAGEVAGARLLRTAGARGRQNAAGRDCRSARSRRFLPLLRAARARGSSRSPERLQGPRASSTSCRCTAAACSRASAPGISRWPSSPGR